MKQQPNSDDQVILDGQSLTASKVLSIAEGAYISIQQTCFETVDRARDEIQKVIDQERIVYGVSTGFGLNADVYIKPEDNAILQANLIRSHACGVGQPYDRKIVRAMMGIRLNTLLAGHSGARRETIQLLAAFLNHDLVPYVPKHGSVGASGDLAPLSHIALALMGEGSLLDSLGNKQAVKPELDRLGLEAIQLQAKEGLALINGTSLMAAMGALALQKCRHLYLLATQQTALALEALCGRRSAYDLRIHQVRRQATQIQAAADIQGLFEDSEWAGITTENLYHQLKEQVQDIDQTALENLSNDVQRARHTHRVLSARPDKTDDDQTLVQLFRLAEKKGTPQDAYCIRCAPQVLGASLQAINHAASVIEAELNAVVDNPIVFPENGDILSGGNFHGQPIAFVLDHLKLAAAEIGNLVERQINKLVDVHHNDGLPNCLVPNAGLNSGVMILQYTAASIVSENKTLAHPASVDSIPTGSNQEDHVSMGPIGGRHLLQIIENVEHIMSIAHYVSVQAIRMRQLQFDGRVQAEMSSFAQAHLQQFSDAGIETIIDDRFMADELQQTSRILGF